jgi:hypothetical protein
MTCISIPIGKEMSFDAQDRNFSIELRLIFFPLKCEGLVPTIHTNRNPFLQTKGLQRNFFLQNSCPSKIPVNLRRPKTMLFASTLYSPLPKTQFRSTNFEFLRNCYAGTKGNPQFSTCKREVSLKFRIVGGRNLTGRRGRGGSRRRRRTRPRRPRTAPCCGGRRPAPSRGG